MMNIQKINTRFKILGENIIRFRWLSIIIFVVVMAGAAGGLRLLESDVSRENWFLEDDALMQTRERFEEIFGNDDFCAVLVEADNVFAPDILSGIRALGQELVEKVPYADDVVSLTDFEFTLGTDEGMEIIDLVPRVIPASSDELSRIRELALSKPSMRNRIVSEDGRYTWIMLRMKPLPDNRQGGDSPDLIIGRTVNEIAGQERYRMLNPKTTGLPVINVEKRAFFARETPKLLGISLVLTVFILAVSLRSLRGVVFPLVTAVSAMVMVFGVQGYMGISSDPSMIFLPVFLSLALAIGYSIHVFNFFTRQFLRTGLRRQSLVHAVEEVGWPLLFSALTTIAAMLTFLFIPMRPIRWVGLTAACLVAVTYVLVILLLPALLSFGRDGEPRAVRGHTSGRPVDRLMDYLGRRVLARPGVTLTVFGLIAAVCLVGFSRFDVSFDVRRTMGVGIPYVERLDYIGKTPVGSLYSYGVAFEFDKPGAAREPENLKKFDRLVEEVQSFRLTKKVSSLLDIIKDMNQVVNAGDPAYHRIPESREMIAQLLLLYENAGGAEAEKWVDYEYQRLRLMVEVDDYNSGEAAGDLGRIQEMGKQMFPDARGLLVGSISQFTVMMDYVTRGQIKTLFIALGVISVLLSLVFGSLKTGLIAMIPNIAPALAVGGIMGFAGIPLDMMTVTVIPMLLGLAVDDTIHFISHSRLEFERTGNYHESICRVFLSVGTALFLTSTVLILCFSAYLASAANVFVNMGILVSAGIAAALAADYFVVPVLLNRVRPFGEETVPAAPALEP